MNKVSIIIPVYNVEKYLRDCLNSVVNQTYKNLEIILINDGSKDNSGKICDEYAQKDNRIIVVHNSNKGVSNARNCGINLSTGKYIVFIDSDDSVENEYISKLMEVNRNNDYDLIFCNMQDIYLNKNKIIKRKKEVPVNFLTGIFKNDYFYLREIIDVPVLKLYKTKIIKENDIRFPEHIFYAEDQMFNFQYYSYVKKYKYIDNILYNYFHRDNKSLSQIINMSIFNMTLEKIIKEKEFFEKNNIKNKEILLNDRIIGTIERFVAIEKKHSYKNHKMVIKKLKNLLYVTTKSSTKKRAIVLKLINSNIFFPIYCYYLFKYYKKKCV